MIVSRRALLARSLRAILGGGATGVLLQRFTRFTWESPTHSRLPFNADRTTGRRPGGEEIVFAFVGTPKCSASRNPALAPMMREALNCLRVRHTPEDVPVIAVGISPIWETSEGSRFLLDILEFDEISVGRSWLNSELVDLAWRDPIAEVATPQVIVHRQTVVHPGDAIRASIVRDQPVVRATGLIGIQRWVDAGLPFGWRS